MDEQKVEAALAASMPRAEPALGDADQFPSLGSQPAAHTAAAPSLLKNPSPAPAVPPSSAQVRLAVTSRLMSVLVA